MRKIPQIILIIKRELVIMKSYGKHFHCCTKCFMQEGKIKPNISYSYYLMDRIANHLFTTWRFLFCLLLVFVLNCQNAKCSEDCGQTFSQPRVRIRDGQETEYSKWPWMVSISLQEENGSRFVCLGALLNSRSVVTAAHCLQNGRTYVLRFGKHYFKIRDDSDVLIRTSTWVIIHPDYSHRTMDSDIALILFEPAIQYSSSVQPICLPTIETTYRNIVPGRIGYVSIWGDTTDGLLLADFPVLSNVDCVRSYRKQKLSLPISRNMFCAGHYNGTYSVCIGDGGSPLVFYDILANRFIVEGLMSFIVRKRRDSQKCGLPGRYPIFTMMVRFVPWIQENIQ